MEHYDEVAWENGNIQGARPVTLPPAAYGRLALQDTRLPANAPAQVLSGAEAQAANADTQPSPATEA